MSRAEELETRSVIQSAEDQVTPPSPHDGPSSSGPTVLWPINFGPLAGLRIQIATSYQGPPASKIAPQNRQRARPDLDRFIKFPPGLFESTVATNRGAA